MLIGEFLHAIDVKGRVFMPAKLREELSECFIITKGLDDCLYGYSIDEWQILEEKIRELPMSKARNLQRFFFSGAVDVEVDKQGRILLPANLREYAGLVKDAIIIGASNHIEIWDKAKWVASSAELTSDLIANAMDELGF